mmetsp:Transcript_45776/g.83886  ORF Transcript_45776/g.83886 Transcript_45776/m.83886 type:complete len:516 (+) Transcript_45776:114-1661(+)
MPAQLESTAEPPTAAGFYSGYSQPDIALLAGGQKFLAHKAALQKVSENFEELLAAAQLESDAPSKSQSMLALDLAGISEAEAVKLVLRQVYNPSTLYRPTSEEVNRQALALAVGFEMQGICGTIEQWMTTKVTESNVEIRMDVSDEMGLPELTAAITSELALSNRSPRQSATRGDAQGRQSRNRSRYTEADWQDAPPFIAKLMEAAEVNSNVAGGVAKWRTTMAAAAGLAPAEHREAIEAIPFRSNTPGLHARAIDELIRKVRGHPAAGHLPAAKAARPAPRKRQLAVPPALDVLDVEEKVDLQTASFKDEAVPPARCSMEKQLLPQCSGNLRADLERLFAARPAWLPARLEEELGFPLETAAAVKLLPFIAYRWVDGPWQGTYSRLGWDPRQSEEAAEAKALQVVRFADPYFQTMEFHMLSEVPDASGPAECHFRTPPSTKAQLYQLVDIEDPDDFVQSVVGGDPSASSCSKKSGWLMGVSFQTVYDRLCVMCQNMREDQAKPAKRRRRDRVPP